MSADRIDEEQTETLLVPTSDSLASIKVFPLIPSLKRDVVVSVTAFAVVAFGVLRAILRMCVEGHWYVQQKRRMCICSHSLNRHRSDLGVRPRQGPSRHLFKLTHGH